VNALRTARRIRAITEHLWGWDEGDGRDGDTIRLTIPNQLGVEYDRELLANIAEHVAPAIGWTPAVTPYA
jgi:hypothetical protein